MAPWKNDSKGIEDYIVQVQGNDLKSRLGAHLEIHPPDEAPNTPPILSFERKREVEIPWNEVDCEAHANASIVAIREYFEHSWGSDVDVTDKWVNDPDRLVNPRSRPWFVQQITPPPPPGPFPEPERPPPPVNDESSVPWQPVYRTSFEGSNRNPEGSLLLEGFVMRHGSGRLYYLMEAEAEQLCVDDFQSFASYNEAWERKIAGIELVFESKEAAEQYYTAFEEIDLRPPLIQRRYEELRILQNFAKSVRDNVVGITNRMVGEIVEKSLNPEELEKLQERVLRLEIGAYDVQRRIERLVADAGRLGYMLFIKDRPEEITDPDGVTTKLEPGQLYTTQNRNAFWNVRETNWVSSKTGWWIFGGKKRRVDVLVPQEKIVLKYQAVDISKDVLTEKRSDYLKKDQQVYVFEQAPAGLATAEGVSLREIMGRCERDETFRRTCVVMLPVYEDSLTGTRLLTKYSVFIRPLPGVVPTMLPRLSLAESLSYRIAWKETRLGELASTINLAPGEERQVTITKQFGQKTMASRTSTSIFDINRSETTDLATEMENQARQERETSSNLQFSSKVSGSYGSPVGASITAEASASGGTTSSLKDTSQAISKVAKKATQSVNQQNRQEVSSTASVETDIRSVDETVATIRNINQGRSLNLMFYRLYNKFEGGLFMDDLRFDVIPGTEVIAGSGVYESKSYSREELPRVIAEFTAAKLPVTVNPAGNYTDILLKSIEKTLVTEYAVESSGSRDAAERAEVSVTETGKAAQRRPTKVESSERMAATSVGVLRLPPARRLESRGALGAASNVETAVAVAEWDERLRMAPILSKKPMVPQDLLVAAPGLYLDATVGAQPSTEPYSELMREQEVRMREAEVFLKASEGVYQRAQASRIANLANVNWLTGYLPDPDEKGATLSLELPLQPGNWELTLNGDRIGRIDHQWFLRRLVKVSLDDGATKPRQPQQWSLLELVDTKSSGPQALIRFLDAPPPVKREKE